MMIGSLTTIRSCNSGRRHHENHEHRDFSEKHAWSMRCSERGMWQTQKTREIARYDERDEPEKGNKRKERHDDIMERSKRGSLKAQWFQKTSYIITHLETFLSFFFSGGGGAPGSIFLVCRRDRTRFIKSRSTFWAVLADVSRNSQPNWRAKAAPSSLETSLSYVLSHLLPTSMNIGSPRLTLRIDWRNISSRSKVDREAIEYTRMKPWPSLNIQIRKKKEWR